MPLFIRYTLILLLSLGTVFCCKAQNNNVWNGANKVAAKGRKTVNNTATKIKKFKNHLQTWGLDSNYKRGIALGVRLNSTGYTGLLYYQQRISKTQNRFYQLSFSEIKHEKQIKQVRQNKGYPELGNATPFIFGKINNAYQVQLGYGREYLVLPGVLEGNLSVSLRCQAGFSLAMLKPYYLKLIYIDFNPDEHAYVQEEKYSEANHDQFLNATRILGAAKWKQGLGEMKYIPGAYVDAAVAIEPIRNKSFIKTVTLGCNVSFQTKSMEIMADQKAYPWSIALYAGLSLGKRWK
ncbi:hypothetical protein [Pedobacter frigoris]|uniref:hypothetical protein n=1 Tax=Pedobacter frigoris TaxID=2571272 RepID=UPI00292DB218|nr:hypothetical protein [Pedobacter frigoris]